MASNQEPEIHPLKRHSSPPAPTADTNTNPLPPPPESPIRHSEPSLDLEVDTSFLSSIFGSDRNEHSSSLAHSTHRPSHSRSAVRYAIEASDENLEARRMVVVTPLSRGDGQAKPAVRRFLSNLRGSAGDVGDVDEDGEVGVRMYRLHAGTSSNMGCCRAFFSFLYAVINCGAAEHSSTSMNDRHYNPNRWITNFFYWLFRKGWRTVIMVSLVNYYILVLTFTLLIVIWTTYVDSDCIVVGGMSLGDMNSTRTWMDAFSLSWNTISTVGYGSSYPALSTEHDHAGDRSCAFISFLTSFEAFVGVVYAGFTGAVIFSKVTRLAQRARVKFSDPLLVRFGSGVGKPDDPRSSRIFGDVEAGAKPPSPFPILEFRIANELHSVPAAEIIGSQVSAVVVIEAQQDGEEVSDELAKEIKLERLRRTMRTKRNSAVSTNSVGQLATLSTVFSSSTEDTNSNRSSRDNISSRSSRDTVSNRSSRDTTQNAPSSPSKASAIQSSVIQKTREYFGNKKMKIDEDVEENGECIVPRMIFCNLSLDHSGHPFFKRLWTFCHTIDGNSPLLSTQAKQRIAENGGLWPDDWNNAQDVRKAIRFNQIIVSFTGVSNISAADVYKQKVYDYVDVTIGYQFVNPMYRSSNGRLKVDLKLINDVVEQNGGGGEILNVIDG